MKDPLHYRNALLGIVGFFSLTLIGLLTKDQLDTALIIGINAISIAIPALIFHCKAFDSIGEYKLEESFESLRNKEFSEQLNDHTLALVAFLSGMLGGTSGFVAFLSIFWHFSGIAAILFGISFIVWMKLLIKCFPVKYPNPPDSN